MITSFIFSAAFKWIALSALLSIGACTIYKKIGDNALDKALVQGQKQKVERRREGLEEAKEYKKEYLKKTSKLPTEGKGISPKEKLNNLFKTFQ